MVYLGTDDHGTWLGGPAGTTIQRGREPAKQWPSPFVQLVAAGRWWTMFFNGDYSDDYRIYVDVITPAVWKHASRVEMVDLDLDVVLHHDGTVELLDEDEFLAHADLFSYPDALIDRARVTAAELMIEVTARSEPFGATGERWLALVHGHGNPSGC